jgi:ankyrin repeat protein
MRAAGYRRERWRRRVGPTVGVPTRVTGLLLVSVATLMMLALPGSSAVLAQAPDTRLVDAVRHHDVDAVRLLLSELVGVDRDIGVSQRQADGATALHWAVYHDDLATTALLVSAGADAGAANDHGVTPLSLACDNAHGAMVEVLLAAGADAEAAVTTGETVLMTCARTGSALAVRALLSAGANVNGRETADNQTALMWAVAQGHPEVVRLLLEQGADVAARSRVRRQVISRRLQSELKYGELGRSYGTDAEETDAGGFTPLLFAARWGQVESAHHLLAAGADANDVGPDGASALLIAVHSGHRDLARLLLERDANPNASAAGYTPLHAAVLTGDLPTVEMLLQLGGRPNAQVTLATKVTRNGQVLMLGEHLLGATPLALAAKFAEVDIMAVLAGAGGDPILPLKNGWTPVMLAAGASWRYGVWDRRDRAIAKHPVFRAEHFDGAAALAAVTLAAELGVAVDADVVAAVDADGNTALHHAVDKGFDPVVEFLVRNGALIDARNSRGQTPLAIVARARSGNTAAAPMTAALLRTLGATTP